MYYIDPTFNSDGDYERFFWKEKLEDHNIEIDIVRIRAMTNCCRKFKTMQLQAVCFRMGGFF